MDLTGLIVLGVLWLLFNLVSQGQGRKKPQRPRQTPRPNLPSSSPPRPEVRHRSQAAGTMDPTQQEGSRLERVLREFERALDQAGSPERPAGLPPREDEEEEWEERESLEVEPEIVSLETEVRRESRPLVDQDDHAERIELHRIAAAATRDQARSKADHAKFDQRIRQEVADKTAAGRYTIEQLRDAVVWREILGPPVSLRGER